MAVYRLRRCALALANDSALLLQTRISSERIIRCFSSQLPIEARRLEGKVAIITGGASGFGEATARTFVAHGAKVVIGDIDDEQGGRVSGSLHPHADFFHCNVVQEKDVSDIVDLAVCKHGHLDIMFNNAGISGRKYRTPAEMSLEDFQRVMDVNVRGVMSGVKHAARAMIARNKGGSILCSASAASVVASRFLPGYTTSKHAVVGIVKSAASDLAPYGIRVNCISPYAVLTPLLLNIFANVEPNDVRRREFVAEHIGKATEFRGATLEADDIAKAALFLSSDDARYISGHNLVIDGAFTSFKQLDR